MAREIIPDIHVSNDSRWIVGGFAGNSGDSLALWDAHSGRLCYERPLQEHLNSVTLDRTGDTIAVECSGNRLTIALFDLKSGQRRATITPRSETYIATDPYFTADGRLLIHTTKQLEWWDPRSGKFLDARPAPQSGEGFLLSTEACGNFRIVAYTNTDFNRGIDPEETRYSIEVLSEKNGALQGVLLKNHSKLLGYATSHNGKYAAVMLGEGTGSRVRVFDVASRRQLAERTFAQNYDENAVRFLENGDSVYVGGATESVWNWRTGMARAARPKEFQNFSTFFLGKREVYHQPEDGTIRDIRTGKPMIQLSSR